MFGYRSDTKADEVVKLAKLYKKTKKYLTMEDVHDIINVVYKGDNDYLATLTALMSSKPTDNKETKEESK